MYPQEDYDHRVLLWTKHMRKERLSERTVHFYAETMHTVAQILDAKDLPVMPKDIRPDDVRVLLDHLAAEGYAVQTRKGYLSTLRKWVKDGGGKVSDWPKARFPAATRPKVDWLTAEQARTLLDADMSLLQSAVISLELRQGLRHVEVIRLRHCDIDYDSHLLTVIGKGPIGGKIRRIPMVPATEAALRLWQDVRDLWVQEGKQRYPATFSDPETVIVWRKAGRLYSYSEEGYGLDKVVTIPLNKQLNFHFSNHTLRRTFGRALYRAEVPVATIAKILGHESTEVTLRYIGVDIDDMRSAMQKEIFV